ncbi:hypothetical protein [Cronobacter sakazakii]|uniref:hypothetical protein n=1 Tax=Cronobacter sakazakii TaxID=28141 RepID=UPI000BE8B7C3|nr:hypothetical protein [Cronobacter sakazakii]PUV27930.1 hypothetical protein CDT98_19120 [Cronobacter sakazakii]
MQKVPFDNPFEGVVNVIWSGVAFALFISLYTLLRAIVTIKILNAEGHKYTSDEIYLFRKEIRIRIVYSAATMAAAAYLAYLNTTFF